MRVLSIIAACTLSAAGLSAAPISYIDLFGEPGLYTDNRRLRQRGRRLPGDECVSAECR